MGEFGIFFVSLQSILRVWVSVLEEGKLYLTAGD